MQSTAQLTDRVAELLADELLTLLHFEEFGRPVVTNPVFAKYIAHLAGRFVFTEADQLEVCSPAQHVQARHAGSVNIHEELVDAHKLVELQGSNQVSRATL